MKGVLISAKPKVPTRSRKTGSRKAAKPARRPQIDGPARTLPTPQHSPVVGEAHSWLQTKLEVGEPDDQLEQEADRVANRVMRMPDSAVESLRGATSSAPPTLQRMCTECEEQEQLQRKCAECEEEETIQRQEMDEEEELIQSKRDAGGRTPAVTPTVASDLARLRRGGGRPLSVSTRAFFEPRFDRDFSGVRVHTGDAAGGLSRRLNARAFTVGNDVFFGRSEYRPQTSNGLRLLAHELTHTVQQTGGFRTASRIQKQTAPSRSKRTPVAPPRSSPTTATNTLTIVLKEDTPIPHAGMVKKVIRDAIGPIARSAGKVLKIKRQRVLPQAGDVQLEFVNTNIKPKRPCDTHILGNQGGGIFVAAHTQVRVCSGARDNPIQRFHLEHVFTKDEEAFGRYLGVTAVHELGHIMARLPHTKDFTNFMNTKAPPLRWRTRRMMRRIWGGKKTFSAGQIKKLKAAIKVGKFSTGVQIKSIKRPGTTQPRPHRRRRRQQSR